MVKMLIDVDTGVDDSIALLYALNHPEVEIVGITTGCGNVDAVQAAENTVRIIELSNTKKEIPVIVGANQPLNGTWEGPVAWIHGENGVGNVLLEKGNFSYRTDIKAEDFLYEMLQKYPQELTLVTLGRLTNIAMMVQKSGDDGRNCKCTGKCISGRRGEYCRRPGSMRSSISYRNGHYSCWTGCDVEDKVEKKTCRTDGNILFGKM